jgi:hypothetical protein
LSIFWEMKRPLLGLQREPLSRIAVVYVMPSMGRGFVSTLYCFGFGTNS